MVFQLGECSCLHVTSATAQVLPGLVEASPESAPEVPPPPPPAEETPSLAQSEAAPEPAESEVSPAATQTAFLLPPKLQAGDFRLLFHLFVLNQPFTLLNSQLGVLL